MCIYMLMNNCFPGDVSSKKSLQIAVSKLPSTTDWSPKVMATNSDNLNQAEISNDDLFVNHDVESTSSLLGRLDNPHPYMERDHFSAIQENLEMPKTQYSEVIAPIYENLNQTRFMSIDDHFANHAFKSNLSLQNSPYDPHSCMEFNNLYAIQENLQVHETQYSELVTPSFENSNINQFSSNDNLFDSYAIASTSSLLSNPYPYMETNDSSTFQPNCEVPEYEFGEVMPLSFKTPNQMDINGNAYSLPSNHGVKNNPSSSLTSPSDLHMLVKSNISASIQETLCMVTENENDVWLKKNRLMALQQLQNDYSSKLPSYNIDTESKFKFFQNFMYVLCVL